MKSRVSKWFRRWVVPGNSLLINLGEFRDGDLQELDTALDEIERFYTWIKASDLVTELRAGRAVGYAALVLEDVRNDLIRGILPRVLGRQIPVTLFLHTECIGMNRLPLDEELDAFQSAYPQQISSSEVNEMKAKIWLEPSAVERYLEQLRSRVGPLPIPSLDPLRFFSTWGRLLDVPEPLRDFGIVVSHHPDAPPTVQEHKTIIRQQTGVHVRIAWSGRFASDPHGWAEQSELQGVVVPQTGRIDRRTDPLALPIWRWDSASQA